MPRKPISRRTLLRGAGCCLALPLLEAMRAPHARAQLPAVQRFVAFFYPNGTDPALWEPPVGALSADTLSACLQDLAGFTAEGPWPAEDASLQDITVVRGIDHSGIALDIHVPSMSLSAHRGMINAFTPGQATLDQAIAEQVSGEVPFRSLILSATTSNDIVQGNISFASGGQVATPMRSPGELFDLLFGGGLAGDDPVAAEQRTLRQGSVLDGIRDDAARLNPRVSVVDRLRLDQYLQAVSELERQVSVVTPSSSCVVPEDPGSGGNFHTKMKQFIDLATLAMACDLTRVVTLQYSDSWGVNYADYQLGEGLESVGTWSDHFLSHKLDDTDRATDLDGLPRAEAQAIANARVVHTSRFKARRFAYVVNSLRRATTPTGNLLDESLVLYASENGDGDSHGRTRMPVLLAGHAGGFETGRVVDAAGEPTGSLHASILTRFGVNAAQYGDPVGSPIAGL